MLKKVKRHRKRRENRRHKKEKKAIRKLKADLFFLFMRQAFIERCKIYKAKKEYPPGGIIQDQTHDLGSEYIVPKRILTTTMSHETTPQTTRKPGA